MRGDDDDSEGCGPPPDSCHDLASPDIEVTSPEQDVGVVLDINGAHPQGLDPDVDRPLAIDEGFVRLAWLSDRGDRSLDFEILVWAIDRAGNMSESPARLRVKHDGDGCSTHGRASNAGWLAALCALLFVRRPRPRTGSV